MLGALKSIAKEGGRMDQLMQVLAIAIITIFALIILAALLACGVAKIPLLGGGQCDNGAGIAGVMLQMGGVVLSIGAALFDWTLTKWLIQAGEKLSVQGGIGTSISVIWTVIRDFVNLVFIGGLIWASINIILGSAQKVGKTVVTILIAALLVNFSYFFAGAVLDASHFTSRLIYQEAIVVSLDSEEGRGDGQFVSALRGGRAVSERFMVATKITTIYDLDESLDKDMTMLLLMGLIGVIFMGATSWIFFTMAALFIQRFIVIVILLMTAPVGILSFINISSIKKYGDAWWSALYSQAVFPVVFLLFAAAALKVLEEASARVLGADASLTSLISQTDFVSISEGGRWTAALDLIIVYALGFGLLFFAMKISQGIARQEEFKPPTTGQFYGAYKKVAPAAIKGVAQVAKSIGGVPLVGSERMTGTKRSLGDALTLKPVWEGAQVPDRFLDRGERRARAIKKDKENEWKESESEYASKLKDPNTTEEDLATARDKAAIAFAELPEEKQEKEKNAARKATEEEREREENPVTDEDKEAAFQDILKTSQYDIDQARRRQADRQKEKGKKPESSGSETSTSKEGAQQLDATQTQQLQKVVTAIEGLTQEAVRGRLTETQRDRIEFTQEKLAERAEEKRDLMALTQDRHTAKMLVDKLRTNGPDGTSQIPALPPEMLAQPEMAKLLNVEEFSAIKRRQAEPGKEPEEGEISDAQMETIAQRAETKVVRKYNESTQAVERGRKAPVVEEPQPSPSPSQPTTNTPPPQGPDTPPNRDGGSGTPEDEN